MAISSFDRQWSAKFWVGWVVAASAVLMALPAAGDALIDLSSADNPCTEIQKALDAAVTAGPGIQVIKIQGHGDVGYGDLQDMGEYRMCFGLIPSEKRHRKGKVTDLIMLHEETMISIDFDNADLAFDAKGQKAPVVLAQFGDFYRRGWEKGGSKAISIDGYIEGGLRMTGRFAIRSTRAQSGKWPLGKISGLPFGGDTSSPTTTVAWFETGLLRADLTTLSLTLLGADGDTDDIGLLHHHGWGIYRGHVRAKGWGVGVLFYGNSIGAIAGGYVSNNGIGVSFGDPWIGADVQPSPDCRRGRDKGDLEGFCDLRSQSAKETVLRNMVLEGNQFGNLIVFDGERLNFDTIHFETGKPKWQKGHSVLIGGGACKLRSVRAGLPCGVDSDCITGKCMSPPRGYARSIRFSGGSIGGDRYSDDWDALFLGPGAVGTGQSDGLVLSTNIILSDVDRSPNITNRCGLPGVRCELFGKHPKSTMHIDASESHFHSRSMSKKKSDPRLRLSDDD